MRDYRAYPTTARKQEMLGVAEDYLNRILDTVHDIQGGAAESYACEKHNIDKSAFRRLVFAQKTGFQYDEKYPKTMTENGEPDTTEMVKMGFLSWQEKLFLDCFSGMDYMEIPPDINESMAFVLDPAHGLLTDREVTVLRLRYEQGMTFGETAKQFNVTQERIRQVEAKAMRKIRGGKATKYLMYGLPYIAQLDKLRSERYSAMRNKELEDLQAHFNNLGKAHDRKAALDLLEAVRAFVEKNYPEQDNNGDIPITAMDFSVRTYNCLARAGINSLNQIRELNWKDLTRIRNMGQKSCMEVVEKVRRFGVFIEVAEEV